MTWSHRFPRWVRILFVSFGLAIIVGGLAGAVACPSLDDVLSALLVGGAWALVGYKGGYPLISTGTGSVQAGLRVLRRRRLLVYLFPIAWAPVLIAGMAAVPPARQLSAFTLLTLPMVVVWARFALSACPRCGHHFFLPPRGAAWWGGRQLAACQVCGLRLRDAAISPPAG